MEYLLKKRYSNIKTKERSTSKVKEKMEEIDVDSDDLESLYKELPKAYQSAVNKGGTEEDLKTLKSLQKLTFKDRKDRIAECTGKNAVQEMLEKFPFLEEEVCVSNASTIISSSFKKLSVNILLLQVAQITTSKRNSKSCHI